MIDQKAREIAEQCVSLSSVERPPRVVAARLGIIEGLEMAAKVADEWNDNSPYISRAAAIRALIEESKG